MKAKWKQLWNKFAELIKYGFFGVITTALNLLLFALLKELGMHYIWANTVSYVIAVVVNFVVNQRFVFERVAEQSSKQYFFQFSKFAIMRFISLGVDNGLFFVMVTLWGWPVYLSRIGLSVVLILATYGINKVFVFKRK